MIIIWLYVVTSSLLTLKRFPCSKSYHNIFDKNPDINFNLGLYGICHAAIDHCPWHYVLGLFKCNDGVELKASS